MRQIQKPCKIRSSPRSLLWETYTPKERGYDVQVSVAVSIDRDTIVRKVLGIFVETETKSRSKITYTLKSNLCNE